MSEAVARLLKGYHDLSDEEQAQFLDQLEPLTPEEAIQAEPGFHEFLAERLAEAEDRTKLLDAKEMFAEVLKEFEAKVR